MIQLKKDVEYDEIDVTKRKGNEFHKDNAEYDERDITKKKNVEYDERDVAKKRCWSWWKL